MKLRRKKKLNEIMRNKKVNEDIKETETFAAIDKKKTVH